MMLVSVVLGAGVVGALYPLDATRKRLKIQSILNGGLTMKPGHP
jgi:hypothetical protein